jgi:hypothetical protein
MFLIPRAWYCIKKSKQKGRGVFALRDIKPGTIIGDYLGTIVNPEKENEKRNGLYTMVAGMKYDILANPKKEGIHLINHSCSNNCDIYPYRGHVLYFASRNIFKGEEITVDYWLYAPGEEKTNCTMHACYCESKNCTGTMHHSLAEYEPLIKIWKKNFGKSYNAMPGPYGTELNPLLRYPQYIKKDYPKVYDLFGSESRPPVRYSDKTLPTITEIRNRIRKTGQRLSFPSFQLCVYGVEGGMLVAERMR